MAVSSCSLILHTDSLVLRNWTIAGNLDASYFDLGSVQQLQPGHSGFDRCPAPTAVWERPKCHPHAMLAQRGAFFHNGVFP